MLDLSRVVIGRTRVRSTICGACPEATVLVVADGQVGIVPDGRPFTYADPATLEEINSL